MRRLSLALLALLLAPSLVLAAPRGADPRPGPPALSAVPAQLQRVMPAVVGIRVHVPPDRPSTATLGRERWGSGVILDAAGHVLTVSYVLLDAESIEVTLQDGRRVPGRLVGLDLEAGLGVLKLAWPGPWPAAALGDSRAVVQGEATATVGMDDDGDLVATHGHVEAIRPFAAAWEYMLDRAFIVSPGNPAFGGGAVVDARGAVIGITSLRLGERPFSNLAIPIDKFLAARDELIARGRVESRPSRPWLGLLTQPVDKQGLVVVGVSPAGPAVRAGFRRGDLIVRLGGEKVASHEEFYTRLWSRQVGEEIVVVVRREDRFEAITVRSADRYKIFRTK
jgi:S1-C subfamily serine protease